MRKLATNAHAWCVFLLLSVTLVFLPGLSGGFLFDDWPTIVENPSVHVDEFDLSSLQRAATSFEPGGRLGARPLSMATFGVNHAFHGLDPRAYKLTNLVIHLANTLLVFWLVFALVVATRERTRPQAEASGKPVVFAGFVALIWAAHPLQVSSVLYVVQRMEVLSTTFVLLALISYLQGRMLQQAGRNGWVWILLSLPLSALGMLAKESAALMPAYALALELGALSFCATKPNVSRTLKLGFAVASISAVVAFLVLIVPSHWNADSPIRNFTGAERLLTQMRVLCLYLGQIVLPLPGTMTFHYDNYEVSRGLLQPPSTLLAGLFLGSLLASGWIFRRKLPLYAVGLFTFFAGHALTSNVILLELVFEHRNYLPLLGIVLSVSALIAKIPREGRAASFRLATGASLATLLFLSVLRAATWGDDLHLATELAERNPGSARASADLATRYLEMTDGYRNSPFHDFAIREFDRGAGLPGSSIVSDQGLILAAASAERPIDPTWWDRLEGKLEHGTISPETTHALFGLLRNRLNGVELDDERLVTAFVILFNRVTLPPYSYAQVGDYVLRHTDDKALADQLFVRAIELSEAHPEYARQVIEVLRRDGNLRQARVALERAHSLNMLLDMATPAPIPDNGQDG